MEHRHWVGGIFGGSQDKKKRFQMHFKGKMSATRFRMSSTNEQRSKELEEVHLAMCPVPFELIKFLNPIL